MTRQHLSTLLIVLAALGAASPGTCGVTLTLNPAGGAIFGAPGDVIGWGFSLTNDTGYAVITSATYNTPGAVGVFDPYIVLPQNFVIIGPGDTWSQTFDAASLSGIAAYHVNPLEVPGAVSMGNIELTYDVFSVDPSDPDFDPSLNTLSTETLVSVPASVTVAAPAAPTPEPGTFAACILGVAVAAFRYRNLGRHSLQ